MPIQFPEDHEFMKTSEIAQALGLSMRVINGWRKKLGIKANPRQANFKDNIATKQWVGLKVSKEVWDNYTWMNFMHNEVGVGIYVLCRMTGIAFENMVKKFKKYKIKKLSGGTVSKNPLASRKWVDENYNIEGKSLRECARLAGVNSYTLQGWLVKFGYEIRDLYECNAGERNSGYGISCIPAKRPEENSTPPKEQSPSTESKI